MGSHSFDSSGSGESANSLYFNTKKLKTKMKNACVGEEARRRMSEWPIRE
jgi:hypothetical protein